MVIPAIGIWLVDGQNTFFGPDFIDGHHDVERPSPFDEKNQFLNDALGNEGFLDDHARVEQILELCQCKVDRAKLVEDVICEHDRVPKDFRSKSFLRHIHTLIQAAGPRREREV